MTFDYEIPVEEYVAAQVLHWRSPSVRRQRIDRALNNLLIGIILTGVACYELIDVAWYQVTLAPILLAILGVWWMYAGMAGLLPKWHAARIYRKTNLAGKKHRAQVTENGLEVSGDSYGYRAQWSDIPIKGEDARVFMLYSQGLGTIFIFGKKYLTEAQQSEIRALAGLDGRDQ